ncbi:MAG: hypothetical protein OEW11_00380 [Nitrospirota bacterium]|nr:hypothetical protein [Nitrospirota bacterium]
MIPIVMIPTVPPSADFPVSADASGHAEAPRAPRAVALVSGGLDSTLAVRMMQEQGVQVEGLHFYTGFCITEQQRRSGNPKAANRPNDGLRAGVELDIPVEIVDISREYLEIVTHPKHGYGANVNPCIDCRAMMLRKAGEIMRERGADFVITGEVLGQRPMSQNRKAMDVIEDEAGLSGRLLRPLSARNLPMTEAERGHLVDRDQLKGMSGRTRKPQIALAQELGVDAYAQPAGGCCFLTDENFARKFRDLFAHDPDLHLDHEQIMLLTVGRHFRLKGGMKVVVGRNAGENLMVQGLVERSVIPGAQLMVVEDRKGPTTVVAGGSNAALDAADARDNMADLTVAAALTARYSDAPEGSEVAVRLWNPACQPQADGRVFNITVVRDGFDDLRV